MGAIGTSFLMKAYGPLVGGGASGAPHVADWVCAGGPCPASPGIILNTPPAADHPGETNQPNNHVFLLPSGSRTHPHHKSLPSVAIRCSIIHPVPPPPQLAAVQPRFSDDMLTDDGSGQPPPRRFHDVPLRIEVVIAGDGGGEASPVLWGRVHGLLRRCHRPHFLYNLLTQRVHPTTGRHVCGGCGGLSRGVEGGAGSRSAQAVAPHPWACRPVFGSI